MSVAARAGLAACVRTATGPCISSWSLIPCMGISVAFDRMCRCVKVVSWANGFPGMISRQDRSRTLAPVGHCPACVRDAAKHAKLGDKGSEPFQVLARELVPSYEEEGFKYLQIWVIQHRASLLPTPGRRWNGCKEVRIPVSVEFCWRQNPKAQHPAAAWRRVE
jgi:hypothetical protein